MASEIEVGKSVKRVDYRGRPYWVQLRWAVVKGRLEVVGVDVSAAKGSALDTSTLRALPLASIAAQERPKMAKLWESHLARPELSDVERRRVREVLAAARAPGDDPELLEFVALTYKAAHQAGRPPTKAVHEELIRKGYELSRQQVGKLVMRCRAPEIGLLGPAAPGRAGEQPRRKGAGK